MKRTPIPWKVSKLYGSKVFRFFGWAKKDPGSDEGRWVENRPKSQSWTDPSEGQSRLVTHADWKSDGLQGDIWSGWLGSSVQSATISRSDLEKIRLAECGCHSLISCIFRYLFWAYPCLKSARRKCRLALIGSNGHVWFYCVLTDARSVRSEPSALKFCWFVLIALLAP